MEIPKKSQKIDKSNLVLVIGSGAAGLAAMSNLQKFGVPFDCIEKNLDTGGIWDYSNPENPIYESTHFISSSKLSGFPDFPMPNDFPDYPSHKLVIKYLRDYTKFLGIKDKIEFGTKVMNIKPIGDLWEVRLDNNDIRLYGSIIIATGHNWDPKFPNYPGEKNFKGEIMHSLKYKTPSIFKDKRVLILGAGNSGCDIAVEAALNSKKTFLSLRRGYFFLPKHIFGVPADRIGEIFSKLRTPIWIRQIFDSILLKLLYGDYKRLGVPKPDHKLYESHPVINSLLFYYLSHGEIEIKPDVSKFTASGVEFTDGSVEDTDLVIYATGYKYSYPFIEKELLDWDETYPRLFAHFFSHKFDNLFMIGLYVNDGSFNIPAYYQSEIVAKYLKNKLNKNYKKNEKFLNRIRKENKNISGGVKYMRNERHKAAVKHFVYINYLKSLSKKI
ncbi:MAG: NAD(P)-binding domain-containing protein [Flammeovirgaceae bacterium]|nr:NAD(P)-binding domain-containing protein [Flammeovirgaceae bacterium]